MSRYSVNFDKLGERRVPESGNLIRRDPRPKDDCSSPILKIPPEIRLLIWQHLLDEIRFTFELKSADVPLDCRITISHYKLMSFLQTCRRFREEGLTVIKPTFTYLTSRSRSVCGVHGTFGHNASLRRVPLQLDDIHATVKHLDIDAEWAATICHAATSRPNPLSKVLNLKTIHVLHSTYRGYLRKLLEDENPRKLDCPKRQFSMIQDLLADGVLPAAPGAPWGTAGATALPLHNLGKILKHIFSQMKGVAITLEADIVSPECGISDDSRCFPISRQLEQSHVRLEIPSLRLTHLSANLYNKAIPFAIKQRWTEVIPTDKAYRELRDKLSSYWSRLM